MIEQISQLIIVIGVLAFIVSVITETIKTLIDIPTDVVVIVLSLVLTVTAFFAYTAYAGIAIAWYLVIAAIIVGFFVAFIAMYGWTKFKELWDRFNIKG